MGKAVSAGMAIVTGRLTTAITMLACLGRCFYDSMVCMSGNAICITYRHIYHVSHLLGAVSIHLLDALHACTCQAVGKETKQ